MTDDWFAPNHRPPTAPAPKPTEPLWTLHKARGKVVECRWLEHGEYGWEAQLYRQGDFAAGRRFNTREEAVAHADKVRGDLVKDGWQASDINGD